MADEDRRFAPNTASSNDAQLRGGGEQDEQLEVLEPALDVDAVEAEAEAEEDTALASRKAEVDCFQGAKTRRATKDIISRRS